MHPLKDRTLPVVARFRPAHKRGMPVAALVARALVPNRYVGFFKTLRTTRWARWDTGLYSPLFLVLGLALIAVSLGSGDRYN